MPDEDAAEVFSSSIKVFKVSPHPLSPARGFCEVLGVAGGLRLGSLEHDPHKFLIGFPPLQFVLISGHTTPLPSIGKSDDAVALASKRPLRSRCRSVVLRP